MVSKQTLLQLVDALVPEIDVNDVIPDIEAKHDEILAIAEAANELRTLSLFQEKVDAELALKRTVDPARAVINASSVKLNFNRNAEIAMLEELKQRSYGKVVVSHEETQGYRRASLRRACCVVNRQLTGVALVLRGRILASTSRRRLSVSGIRCDKHMFDKTASSISAMFSQLPCLGV